jgi:hypothetical protein
MKAKMEAWYRCPRHGWQCHPTGANLALPCLMCKLEFPESADARASLGDWECTTPARNK